MLNIRHACRAPIKKLRKSLREPFKRTFSRRTCQNLVWGAPGLDFVMVWNLPSASWTALGRSWEPLGRFLGASWTALGPLLGALGCLLAATSCPRRPRTRFQKVLRVSREGLVRRSVRSTWNLVGSFLGQCVPYPSGPLLEPPWGLMLAHFSLS